MPKASFRFYEELNDFLQPARRKVEFEHVFRDRASVKDMIEALGIPHTEVEVILVNGESVNFSYAVADGDRVSVYPMFESLDVTPLLRLRPRPLRRPRFVLDAHLGALARRLRMLGFDTLYRNDYGDPELARLSHDEKRILLTRDIGLLKRSLVTHGLFLRQTQPRKQVQEVLERLDLVRAIHPFSRCIACNGRLAVVAKAHVRHRLPPDTLAHHNRFRQCRDCARIYWGGGHYRRMQHWIQELMRDFSTDE